MKIINCKECDSQFDLHSEAKKQSGGLIFLCPDCSEESTVKYVGLQSADGKQSQATILKFNSNQDKNDYIAYWQNVTGLHKGKVCQLSKSAKTTPSIPFTTVVSHNPTNHKGKSD